MKNLELVILGLVAGFASAALGIGGGVVIVPALVIFLGVDIKKAAGSSLAVLAPIAFTGVVSHYIINSGNIRWVVVLFTAIGAVSGAVAGEKLNRAMSGRHLEWLLALLLLFTGLKLAGIIRMPLVEVTGGASYPFLAVLGLVAGISSALFGIGGGVIMVPGFYILFGLSMHEAIPTSLAVILPTTVTGAVLHLRRDNADLAVIRYTMLPALAGAVLGAITENIVPGDALKVAFTVFMFLCAARLFFRKKKIA
jgi:uncharacterized membrane protein YfcA